MLGFSKISLNILKKILQFFKPKGPWQRIQICYDSIHESVYVDGQLRFKYLVNPDKMGISNFKAYNYKLTPEEIDKEFKEFSN